MTKHQKAAMGLELDSDLASLALALAGSLPDLTGAACDDKSIDPDLFFDESKKAVLEAKAICARCPVIDKCLSYAMGRKEYGVWGGQTEKERVRLRRQLAGAAASVDVDQAENYRLLCSTQSASQLAKHFKVSARTIQRWRKEIAARNATNPGSTNANTAGAEAAGSLAA